MTTLFHDYETYSDLDIKKVGAYKYATHPSTEVLMASWALDNEKVQHWEVWCGDYPQDLYNYLLDPNIKKSAFNATFEYLITKHVLKLPVKIEEFYCTMVHAWSLSFSGGLADVGRQMGLPQDTQKLADGQKLINRFCKPAPSNHKAYRYTYSSHPEEWTRFCEYNIQDTVSERAVASLLTPYPVMEQERELWLLDAEINQRGVPVDRHLIKEALEVSKLEKHALMAKLRDLTGLVNPNSNQQLMPWLNARGCELENMQRETLEAELKELRAEDQQTFDPPQEQPNSSFYELPIEVIELKLQVSKTSTAKWQAFDRCIMDDDRVRGMFAFGGAQRTQRWGGRIVQLMNLPRGNIGDPRPAAEMMAILGYEGLTEYYSPVMDTLSAMTRCAITAPLGKSLVVCDLASIESRVVGYMAGCTKINNIFASGKDMYKTFAVDHFRKSYDEITKAERTFSKPPILGGVYGLSWKGLITYAEGMGVIMSEEEAQNAIYTLRNSYPEIPSMWYWLNDKCMEVIQHNTSVEGYGVRIYRDPNFLFIELPSGRKIAYYQPLIIQKVPPWEWEKKEEVEERRQKAILAGEEPEPEYEPKTKPTVSYMGMDQYSQKWKRISTHGAKILENISQSMSRDVLAVWMQRIAEYYEIVLHVHDEVGDEVDDDQAGDALQFMINAAREPIPWAPDLLLDAAGFITKRYYKD